ncbi:MAG TPA: dUTP diphosphatase [Candidatus Nanoarchaeia archaeon]|nr:dUTP diphosphatase [Candidatus Nanoarchaeia archaeon]
MPILVKKLTPESILPKYVRDGDAAMDLYANETAIINPQERKIIATGIAMAVPSNYVGLIWDRSGMAANHGIKTMGGVLDPNYRGELKIILHNLSSQPFTVEKGMRIAQMIIHSIEPQQILEVQDLDETNRGEKRFGSSGMF